ncbi:LLM class F420-dependent oxidoreductase [Streptomyces botrytidirepellens]|uniref:LLM class F420-dependent oxidoreductase n=1 Tax=Streptomyces botrytidirepellens TaxID=2486417 RepID=A0A3M8TN21_9ACTN|nr:LLM class F420-dependent oxidoreductase [Streptomyces botrytidirepellens]RNF92252.1 LLM class F420-dependent oxidoreductase [Streptomyces botrytidirepellens]
MRIGVQLHPQHTGIQELRAAWRQADALGVDSLWTWDHFLPHTGDPGGTHYECWSLLSAMAVETRHATIGPLVTCTAFRNPHLLADMARTVDQLSGGRLVLGLGAGWFEAEHTEYGIPFPGPAGRMDAFAASVAAVKERLAKLNPGPAGPLPLLIGGAGRRRTLELVAREADWWNWYGWAATDPVAEFRELNRALDEWCERVGRDPGQVARTVMVNPDQLPLAEGFAEAGAVHLVLSLPAPYDLGAVESLLALRAALTP